VASGAAGPSLQSNPAKMPAKMPLAIDKEDRFLLHLGEYPSDQAKGRIGIVRVNGLVSQLI
jgi:hypothetical protein